MRPVIRQHSVWRWDLIGAMYFDVGDHILLRTLRLGRVAYAFPVTVVRDDADFSALYLAAGTPTKERRMPDGSPLTHDIPYAKRHAAGNHIGDGMWRENSVLQLTRPGESHSFQAFRRDSDGEFIGWYVNLQSPLSRTSRGFDVEDHILDIVVEPSGRWTWKDEGELDEAVRVGRFTRKQAEEIRAEGERAIRKIENRAWPVGSEWEEWRPDAVWEIPTVPDGWEIL